ncbi:hypothetical protein [Streptomyces acidiscabies]|uniref:Uncharacterized protein n=1 Tax=Streptomyces acidiscabies TaxID=42234 RepID=A0AAP6EJU0_9ACTN|nr:hypothetical protein [Streptomyces acidiscabies]MBZ3916862.1 hypothetical protein [Streptomyces acidiscabies]MDX2964881.1 hypothetical protein [Streptomyces acidiscabies]MDX3023011.1 hypothetical protein [Streptomyces acidiscabies]MDX3792979.1 hypothetical protein [Streptomyces acidiscabies]GAQ52608.1 hypothetical protein a10_02403 [Streptomyces acidiscabies]
MHRNPSARSLKDKVLARAMKFAAAVRLPGARAKLAKCPQFPQCAQQKN